MTSHPLTTNDKFSVFLSQYLKIGKQAMIKLDFSYYLGFYF